MARVVRSTNNPKPSDNDPDIELDDLDNAEDVEAPQNDDQADEAGELASQAPEGSVPAQKPSEVADLDESYEAAPKGTVVEDMEDVDKSVKDGVFSDDVFLKIVPHNSKRPTYVQMGVKGSRAPIK